MSLWFLIIVPCSLYHLNSSSASDLTNSIGSALQSYSPSHGATSHNHNLHNLPASSFLLLI